MSFTYKVDDDSQEITSYWKIVSNHGLISIPLKRKIYVAQKRGSFDTIVGFVGDHKEEHRKFEFPDGTFIGRTIVTDWYVVLLSARNDWNRLSGQEKLNVAIKIPYEIIKLPEITIL